MEGSRDEVVRYIRLVESEFQNPDERTSTAKAQDWAVNLAGGSAALAALGMMNIFRRDGGRQVGTGTYDADKLERLRLTGVALQRQMRRRVEEHKLQSIHTRAPASELYRAFVALLIDDGTVNANVLRREAPDKRTLELVDKGKQSVCDPFWVAKLRAGSLWVSNVTAPSPGEPLATPTVDAHSGLPMTAALDVFRHLWFRGPGSIAPAHVAVWRHPDSIADTAKQLQKHVKTPRIKIAIYSAIASGRVRTSRDAVPNDKALLRLYHGNTGDADVGGLSRAQFDVLHAYRDGWKWSPFIPKPEGSDTTPTTSRYRVPKPISVTAWDEAMWIVSIVYTSTEAGMVSAGGLSLLDLSTPVVPLSTQMRSSGGSCFLRVWASAAQSRWKAASLHFKTHKGDEVHRPSHWLHSGVEKKCERGQSIWHCTAGRSDD